MPSIYPCSMEVRDTRLACPSACLRAGSAAWLSLSSFPCCAPAVGFCALSPCARTHAGLYASFLPLPLHAQTTGVLDAEERLCLFDLTVATFFLSYILIVMIVVVNIVLAVLLDEFLKAAEEEKTVTPNARVLSRAILPALALARGAVELERRAVKRCSIAELHLKILNGAKVQLQRAPRLLVCEVGRTRRNVR